MLTSSPVQWQDNEIVYADNYEHQPLVLRKIISKMLQMNPIERYQTAEDVISELNKLEQKDWQTEEEDATCLMGSGIFSLLKSYLN